MAERRFDKLVAFAKLESTYGVDAGLAAANALVLSQVTFTPVAGEEVTRDLIRPFLGGQERVPVNEHVLLTARIELTGAGTPGTVPKWAPLIRSAGFAQTVQAAGSVAASPPVEVATPTGDFTYSGGTYTGTIDRIVTLECTTAGGTGVAAFHVTAPAAFGVAAYDQAGVVMTNAAPFAIPNGTITPTVGTAFVLGDTFTIAVEAPRVEYDPVSDGFDALSMIFELDGINHKFVGTRAGVAFDYSARRFPYMNFSWMGMLGPITDIAPSSVDWSGWQEPEVITKDNTPFFRLNGQSLVTEQLQVDLGNRLVHTDRIGARNVRITGRDPSGSALWETVDLADLDPFALHFARTKVPIALLHGTAPGRLIQLDAPSVQLGRPNYQNADGLALTTCSLFILPTQAGDDEIKLTVR